MSDALVVLVGINLAVAAAVAAVMLLRGPARRLFGAGAAYGLWTLAPLAGLAMVLPARVVVLARAPPAPGAGGAIWSEAMAAPLRPAFDWPPLLAGLWIAGGPASLAALAWQQNRFGRAVRAGRGGPAVPGP